MKILEKEIDLREETRTAEQAREGITAEKHLVTANSLADTQDEIADRAETNKEERGDQGDDRPHSNILVGSPTVQATMI